MRVLVVEDEAALRETLKTRLAAAGFTVDVAVDGNEAGLPGVPAEERNPHQFALEDVGRVAHHGVEREGLPSRLMLAGDDAGAARNLVEPAPFDLDAANDAKEPKARSRVGADENKQHPVRQNQSRQRYDRMNSQVAVEQYVEQQRAQSKGCRSGQGDLLEKMAMR